jgi:O-antigen/teichoic acid export membrane protein
MSEIRELGSKSAIVFTGKIVGQFIGFISVIIIGRLLGAEIYGQFVYVTSFLTFFIIIPKLGMENGIVSFLSRNTISKEEKRSILSFSLLLSGVLSLIVIVVSYLNAEFILKTLLNDVAYGELLLILLPTIILDSVKAMLQSSLRAVRKIKEITFMENLFAPISKILFVILLVIIFNIQNYLPLVIPLYVNSFVSIVYYIYKLNKLGLIGRVYKQFDNIQLVRFSLPLLFAGVVSIITHNVDQYMIGYMRGATEVGIYRIALQFGTFSSMALIAVNTVFAPLISNLFHDNRISDLSNMYKVTTKWITAINLMIFGMILVFSEDIMHLAGEEFMAGSVALILVCLGQIINSIVGSVGYLNTMTGHPQLNLIGSVIAMAVNVTLNLILIRPFGINGAAIATAASLGIQNIINFIFMYKNLKIHPYDKSYISLFGVLALSTVTIFILSRFMDINYLLRLIICGVVYSALFVFLVFKFVMSEYEVNTLKREIKKVFKKV